MIVCVCRGISDRTIRAAAEAGQSLHEVMGSTCAGTDCGKCRIVMARIVHEAQAHGVTGSVAAAAASAERTAA